VGRAGRVAETVPAAQMLRLEGCRHQVFADFGARAGELVADWLAGRSVL
jgi:hypothetical protein